MNQLLKGNNLIINKKEKIIKLYFLSVLSGVFLFAAYTNAQEASIQVGPTTRKMIVYAPSGIENNRPLLIFLHGMGSKMEDQEAVVQFGQVADANNFVLVYPQGINNVWQLSGTADIDFILAIIDEMYKRYNIDRDRVYLSGFSMGGMLTYYAATRIADKIAAFAPVSGFLMSGPNTSSSRPIPLIHIHGGDDTFVPYANVQTHLDAWIARNNCPTTAKVTKPYPVGKSSSKSSKSYWGPGTDGVEVVLVTIGGIGHWYSIDPSGVNPGEEIWDFCKKYSLNYGVPYFMYASVTDNNPRQIQVSLNKAIIDSNYFRGFTVKINDQDVTIDSIVLADQDKLLINLSDSIEKDNKITLSYSNGNVFSVYNKSLVNFNDTLVDNLLIGSPPRIVEAATNKKGDTLMIKFNKKMQIPSDISALSINAEYNGQMSIPILPGSFFNNDSTILSFPLNDTVYRDYKLLFTYSGNNIISADSGLSKIATDFPVNNNSDGLPVHINSADIGADGTSLLLKFSKPMSLEDVQPENFSFYKNGEQVTLTDFSVKDSTIKFILSISVHYGDAVLISYTPGIVKAADNGLLEGFSDFTVANDYVPVWVGIPAKIEAENFSSQWGIQTERTGDTGGGLNIGYFDNGDWLEYTIVNNTSDTSYQITFRVSAPGNGSVISFYIDGKIAGNVTVPATGDWQVYKSVDENISISQGKHYLRIVATKAGFNLNYMDIHEEVVTPTGIKNAADEKFTIYPNPASGELTISSGDFRHNKIEIFDMKGNLVISTATAGEPVLQLPVHLSDGIYIIKISNETRYQIKKIEIANR